MRTTETRIIPVKTFNEPYPLEAMALHIAFEFNRLFFTARPENFDAPGELGGCYRESFLIHFRNVLLFLYGKRTIGNKNTEMDSFASDYLYGVTWTPAKPGWGGEYQIRCNQLLAHLTYRRVTEYEEKDAMVWKGLPTKATYLRGEWEAFLRALPSGRRAWFQLPA